MRNLAVAAAALGLVLVLAPTTPVGAAEDNESSRLLTPRGFSVADQPSAALAAVSSRRVAATSSNFVGLMMIAARRGRSGAPSRRKLPRVGRGRA